MRNCLGAIMVVVAREQLGEARELIVALVLRGALDWDRRVITLATRFPIRFLKILEVGPDEESTLRRELAAQLLAMEECCMDAQDGPYNDFTSKTRAAYYEDFCMMQRRGTCTYTLWAYLAGARCVMSIENQEVEGWNHVLQVMFRRARRAGVRLASDRMNMKSAAPLNLELAVSLHESVKSYKKSAANADRFAPI